jgi:hypothetical protein
MLGMLECCCALSDGVNIHSHAPAFLGASSANLSALFAVLICKHIAFFCAVVAYRRAQAAMFLYILSVRSHAGG